MTDKRFVDFSDATSPHHNPFSRSNDRRVIFNAETSPIRQFRIPNFAFRILIFPCFFPLFLI